ncbi:MAG: tRNA pseudouridine(55) synthase TruB [Pseudomonadota bacterium]
MTFNRILIINKPTGITSFKVTSFIKKKLNIKKVGHIGTLDPLASGVLPIAVAEGTKIIPFLEDGFKVYRASLKFGYVSDTYDSDGNVEEYKKNFKISRDNILEKLEDFEGEIQQVPPKFSAIKINGKRAYDLARQGKEFEIKKRKVTIHEIKLENYENVEATIYIKCSKGTYIRSIANDLGQKLGCGAILSGLVRLEAYPFKIEDSIDFNEFEDMGIEELRLRAMRLSKCLAEYRSIEISEKEKEEVYRSGRLNIRVKIEDERQKIKIIDEDENLIAIARQLDSGYLQMLRVFNGEN